MFIAMKTNCRTEKKERKKSCSPYLEIQFSCLGMERATEFHEGWGRGGGRNPDN